jgi:membrane protein YqaA with SNARE-associated domain
MEAWLTAGIHGLLEALALPQVGLSAVFVVAFVSATLLPMGSEPAVYGLVYLRPELFWPAVLVATAGNTLGGTLSWWMGAGAQSATSWWRRGRDDRAAEYARADQPVQALSATPSSPPSSTTSATPSETPTDRWQQRAMVWLQRFGPKACLVSWLPLVGDPLCAVAGWLRLPFWPCVFYMAIGKFLRYSMATGFLIWLT